MSRKRLATDYRHVDDVRRHVEACEFNPTAPGVDCRVSANVGDLMAAALAAAGSYALHMGGRAACETDYLAASGAIFPPIPLDELISFNQETLSERMDEAAEFERYRKVARFFHRGGRA